MVSIGTKLNVKSNFGVYISSKSKSESNCGELIFVFIYWIKYFHIVPLVFSNCSKAYSFIQCFQCQIQCLSFKLIPIVYQINHLALNFTHIKCHIKYFAVPEVISQTKYLTKYWHKSEVIGIQILSLKALNGPTPGNRLIFY